MTRNKTNPIRAVLSMLLAVLMIFALLSLSGLGSITADAAGTVTVTPASGQTLTQATSDEIIAKDKIISITTPSTITDSDTVTYTIYKIFDAVSSSAGTSYKAIPGGVSLPIVTDGAGKYKFDVDGGGNVKYYTRQQTWDDYVENTDENATLSDSMIQKLGEQSNVSKYTVIGTVAITGANQTANVKLADYGYYYISSSVGSVVAINTTHPSATIVDKNVIPTIDKKQSLTDGKQVDSETNTTTYSNSGFTKEGLSASIGDTVYYSVPVTVSKKSDKEIVITDLISEGLTLNTSILAQTSSMDSNTVTSQYRVSPWNQSTTDTYTANWTKTDGTFDSNGDVWMEGTSSGLKYNKYTVKIPVDLLKLFSTWSSHPEYPGDTYTFTLYYSATINSNAVAGTADKNRAQLHYDNYTTPFHEVAVTTYDFDLVKTTVNDTTHTVLGYDSTNGGLSSKTGDYAHFKLYKANAAGTGPDTDNGAVYFTSADSSIAESDEDTNKGLVTTYTVTPSTTEGKTDTIGAGDVRIRGLGAGTYYLAEESAPDGYNKVADNIKVVVSEDGVKVDTGSVAAAHATVSAGSRTDGGAVKAATYTSGGVEVQNSAGAVLPSTGGRGTTMLYIIGAVIVAGAGVALVMRKRKRV